MATSTAGSSAAKSGTTKSGSGRKKKVASQAGVKRYGKPIGSEIGGARDANHAAIQQDQGARKNYSGLVSGDRAAQQKALDAMNTEDLNKLADIAFSFRSSNPQVVALRIQARNAQARRGIHVKVGQTQTYPKGAPAKAAPVNYSNRGATKALANEVGANSARLIEMSIVEDKTGRPPPPMKKKGTTAGLGNFPITDLKSLRNAISAIGRAKPQDRSKVARHIVTMAGKLKAGHLISPAIRHYAAGHSAPVQLAGHWKHGYIPLDAEAVASKMKGGKGKPWWDGPGHSGGSAKKALHGSPKSGSLQRTKVVKSGSADSTTKGATVERNVNKVIENKTTGRFHAIDPATGSAHRSESGKPHAFTTRQAAEQFGRPQDTTGKSQLKFETNYSKMTEAEVHKAYLAAPKGSPEKAAHAAALKQKFDARAKKDIANSKARLAKLGIDAHGNKVVPAKVSTAPKSKDTTALHGPTAVQNAKNYVKMHGDAGARKKIAALEARQKLSSNDKALLGALKAEAGSKAAPAVNQRQGNRLINERNQITRRIKAGQGTTADEKRAAEIDALLNSKKAAAPTETAQQKYLRLKREGKSHSEAMAIVSGKTPSKANAGADRIDAAARRGKLKQ